MVEGRTAFRRLSLRRLELKRDVVGSFSPGRVAVRAVAEQAELPRHDFSPVALAASVLSFVHAGSEPSFDVNLTAFAQEPVARIGQRSECDDPMPISALLFRAIAVRKALRSKPTRNSPRSALTAEHECRG
jgi:hypothetical protein